MKPTAAHPLEDRVRAALRTRAGEITPARIPPLRRTASEPMADRRRDRWRDEWQGDGRDVRRGGA